MPMYGAKLFDVAPAATSTPKPDQEGGGGETVFEIDFTGEKFTDKDAYEETLKLYNDRVWTDRCTGEWHDARVSGSMHGWRAR